MNHLNQKSLSAPGHLASAKLEQLNSSSTANGDRAHSPIVLTGDRPTGHLHLGHYVGSLVSRLELQKTNPVYVLVADSQVLNQDITKAKNIKEYTLSLMRSYLSAGLNPEKITFIRQSSVPEIFELSNYLSNLVSLAFVTRNPTIRAEQKMYGNELNMGFLNYPVSQTADIAIFDAELVPVGADQTPILEFAQDVLDKFHHTFKCRIFKDIKPILSSDSRLMGIDGINKMSKSLDNAIFLNDSTAQVKAKINKMYTDSGHIKITDPGRIEGHVVFSFLDVFYKDTQHLQELKEHYKRGGLGDSHLKNLLLIEIEKILEPMREKSLEFSDDYLIEVLESGSQRARNAAAHKMQEIKNVMFS